MGVGLGGSLEPVDEKHTFVTKPWDLYTARELHDLCTSHL